ncbi:hypothetical protein ACU8V3_12480 [Cobetia marina]
MQSTLRDLLSDWSLFLGWLLLMLPSLVWVLRDLTTSNAHLAPMMKWVWGLTTLYSGIVGLLVYRFAGRRQIADNRDARKGLRSVAHCYSGCGLGEFVGLCWRWVCWHWATSRRRSSPSSSPTCSASC